VNGATLVVDGAHTAGWHNNDWDAVIVDHFPQRPRRRLTED